MAYCHCAIQEYKETIYYQETFVLDQALSRYVFIIFISKEIYPTDGIQMGESTQRMQIIKRKASNMKGYNRENKKSKQSLWSGYNSVYRRSYVLAIGGSVFIEAGAVEIFAFSLENHHGVNSEKNWVYGLIITDTFTASYLIGVLPNRRTTTGQLAKSLLPVGVMMCVLTEHDLILLDCCDIVDSATGYLLEFFAYMASSHLVIHISVPKETESD
ncbi:hypothetical protein RhiirA5_421414 [Rhizophagus irregularis]|uniref:Uncharacterized protein n=1 Tax=Rhizophagus irregularis TaxID=588596 RepID=A0A2N0S6G8_9GLOM|nr:hypothetical protein RhiirA5_421414 [Rhizophagus irregularis]PKC71143.1 hypothetical protein RhiirA1_453871 [Rhizophagus irregularis]